MTFPIKKRIHTELFINRNKGFIYKIVKLSEEGDKEWINKITNLLEEGKTEK